MHLHREKEKRNNVPLWKSTHLQSFGYLHSRWVFTMFFGLGFFTLNSKIGIFSDLSFFLVQIPAFFREENQTKTSFSNRALLWLCFATNRGVKNSVMILRVRLFWSFCWKNPVFWKKPGFFLNTLDKKPVFFGQKPEKTRFFEKLGFFTHHLGFLKLGFSPPPLNLEYKNSGFFTQRKLFFQTSINDVLRLGMDR